MSDETLEVTGGCYCGLVQFRATGVRPSISECHCSQCRKQSGHRYATTTAKTSDIQIEGADQISWFQATAAARRGFCRSCGSHLFWQSLTEDRSAILAAAIDEPNGLQLTKHIFAADKGGYYEITDGLPQFEDYTTPLKQAPDR